MSNIPDEITRINSLLELRDIEIGALRREIGRRNAEISDSKQRLINAETVIRNLVYRESLRHSAV
jgi:hypothetical protein